MKYYKLFLSLFCLFVFSESIGYLIGIYPKTNEILIGLIPINFVGFLMWLMDYLNVSNNS